MVAFILPQEWKFHALLVIISAGYERKLNAVMVKVSWLLWWGMWNMQLWFKSQFWGVAVGKDHAQQSEMMNLQEGACHDPPTSFSRDCRCTQRSIWMSWSSCWSPGSRKPLGIRYLLSSMTVNHAKPQESLGGGSLTSSLTSPHPINGLQTHLPLT